MDNKFLGGIFGMIPSNKTRGRMSQAEQGVETSKKSALLCGFGAGFLTLGTALFQHWKRKGEPQDDRRGPKPQRRY